MMACIMCKGKGHCAENCRSTDVKAKAPVAKISPVINDEDISLICTIAADINERKSAENRSNPPVADC